MTVHPSADVDADASIDPTAQVWHLAQVRSDASIGRNCVVGRGAYVGSGVVVGDNCKIQNYALVYEPARLGRGVFIGPAAILTNDRNPRAVRPDGDLKSADDWDVVGVTVEDGASIGAGAVCVAPLRIGEWAMVAAGSVVTRDIPRFALVAGTPARQLGWVGRHGARLHPDPSRPDTWICPLSGDAYHQLDPEQLVEVERQ